MYAGRMVMHVKQQFVILRFHNKFINLLNTRHSGTFVFVVSSVSKNSFTLGGIMRIWLPIFGLWKSFVYSQMIESVDIYRLKEDNESHR